MTIKRDQYWKSWFGVFLRPLGNKGKYCLVDWAIPESKISMLWFLVIENVLSIYGFSRTIVAPSLYSCTDYLILWRWLSCQHHRLSRMLQILSEKTYNRRFLANPTDKYAHQCSGAPSVWLGAPLHWLAYLSVGNTRHRRLYRLCDRIFNVCATLHGGPQTRPDEKGVKFICLKEEK